MNNSVLHIDTTAAPGKAMLDPVHTGSTDGDKIGRRTYWQCIIPDAVLPSETRWWCWWSRWSWSRLSSCGLWASIHMCRTHTHTSNKHTQPMSENRQDTSPFFLICFFNFYILLSTLCLSTHQHDHVTLWRQHASVCVRTRRLETAKYLVLLIDISFSPKGRQWKKSTQTAEDPSRKWTSEFNSVTLFSFSFFLFIN